MRESHQRQLVLRSVRRLLLDYHDMTFILTGRSSVELVCTWALVEGILVSIHNIQEHGLAMVQHLGCRIVGRFTARHV